MTYMIPVSRSVALLIQRQSVFLWSTMGGGWKSMIYGVVAIGLFGVAAFIGNGRSGWVVLCSCPSREGLWVESVVAAIGAGPYSAGGAVE